MQDATWRQAYIVSNNLATFLWAISQRNVIAIPVEGVRIQLVNVCGDLQRGSPCEGTSLFHHARSAKSKHPPAIVLKTILPATGCIHLVRKLVPTQVRGGGYLLDIW